MPSFQERPHRQIIGSAFELVNQNSSAANQWFGRTNIASDTNGMTGVVSTALVNSDSLIQVTMEWKANGPTVPFGVRSISAGGSFVIANQASCTAVGSAVAMWSITNPAGS